MAQTESKQTPTTVEQVPPAEQEPAAPVATPSQRFTNLVISEFGAATANPIQLNNNQKRLVQGYFIIIDRLLKEAESKRLAKNESNTNHQYDNIIPYDWQHVNMADLALDAVHAARMGLDMQEEAHLYPIPFANKKKGCYDIAFMEGYAGKQYKAVKYALVPPKAVTIEVVYSTDNFKAIKKSRTNPYDTYEFEITQPFNRGDIVGGFGYIEYDDPYKNELVITTLKDIKKRAQKGSAEFWGTEMTGKKVQVWENGTEIGVLLSLPEEQRGRILTAILCDTTGQELPQMDASDNAIFTLVNAQVKRAAELSSKRKQSAKSRWQSQATDDNSNEQAEYGSTIPMQDNNADVQTNANGMQNDTSGEPIIGSGRIMLSRLARRQSGL